MRKHFLILMLLSLLPLAGWAAEPAVTAAPAAAAVVAYNQSAQALITAGTATTGNTLHYAVVDAGAAAPTTSEGSTTVPSKTNAGSYDVYYWTVDDTSDAASDMVKITVTIPKAGTITVKALNPTMVYGGTAPAVEDYYEITAGAFLAGESVATLGHPVSVPSIETDEAGNKAFTLVANEYTNYDVALTVPSGTLTISRKAITVTTAAIEDFTYGTATPTFSVADYSAGLVGDDELEGTPEFVIKQGDEVITASPLPQGTYDVYPSGLENDNYNITFAKASFTVNKKALAPGMIAAMASKIYNGANQKPTLTVADGDLLKASDYTVSWTGPVGAIADPNAADAFKTAGTYTVTLSGAGNYKTPAGSAEEPAATATYVINKKTLHIKTKNVEKPYKGTGTPYTVTASADYLTFVDLEDGDAADYDGLTVALGAVDGLTTGEDAGVYPINVTLNETDYENDNDLYANYTPELGSIGKFTITPKEIEIIANDIQKNYGETDTYAAGKLATACTAGSTTAGTAKLVGTLATGDAISTLPTLTREAGETAKDYELTPSAVVIKNGDKDNTKNYTITYTPGKFTIVAGGFTIWADDKTSVFGEELKTLTATISGIPAEDAAKIQASVNAALSVPATAKNRGSYVISIDKNNIDFSPIADLYDIDAVAVVPGNYTITPAPLKIKAATQALNVGDEVKAASAETIEFVTEGVSDEDKAQVITHVTLAFSDASPAVPVTTGELTADAIASGWTEAGAASTAEAYKGIWNSGIKITATAYNALTTANYTLNPAVAAGAEAAAGKLVVTAAANTVTLDGYISSSADVTTNIAALTDNDGKKANVKFANRSLTKEQWGVMVLPFATTVREISNAFGYAVVDLIDPSKGDENNAYFKIHMGEIPANTPFMVKTDGAVNLATAGTTVSGVEHVVFTGKTIVKDVDAEGKTSGVDGAAGTKFYGVYKPVTLSHNYQWFISDGAWSKKDEGKTTTVRAIRAFLQLPETADVAAARVFIEEPDGTVTAIKAVNVDGLEVSNGSWYTLGGIKLQGQPTEKGVYIHNGKKVVIK